MVEEKKEEKAQEAAQPKVEEKVQGTPAAGAQTAPAQAPSQSAQKAAPVKKERSANCGACNKSIKNKRWYYRNGKYYCTKRCWKTASKKKEEAPKEAAAEKK